VTLTAHCPVGFQQLENLLSDMTKTYSINLDRWQHSHAFGQDRKRPGELRTLLVIAITSTMMAVEIVTGLTFGSMALLADGLHMASHAVALGINAFAYIYARQHAHDQQFSFGTGKVNALGGFTGAVLLATFALIMASESIGRMIHPTEIAFNQAILVAVLGLVVNGASMFILGDRHEHHHGHHEQAAEHRDHDQDHHADHHDHNLRSAYLHVLADALTSFLAIFALLAAKYFGFVWMDPAMGIVGAVMVAIWSWGLLRSTSAVLLDKQSSEHLREEIRDCIENGDGSRVADLHLWAIGPGIYSAIISIVARDPKPPDYYKQLIPSDLGLMHVTCEVHPQEQE